MALPLWCPVNPAWWTRLYDAVGAIFRHPSRRVTVDLPAYAGWGAWTFAPDEEGRAFLRSAPPLPLDSAIRKAQMAVAKGEREAHLTVDEYKAVRSDLYSSAPMDGGELTLFGVRLRIDLGVSRLDASVAERAHRADDAAQRRPATPQEAAMTRNAVRRAWDITPEEVERGRCKPCPAENARRYSEEGGTW